MCTGLEIAAIVGATASVASAVHTMSQDSGTPTVLASSPVADQAKIDADSAAAAAQQKTQLRRRLRASSLLATGGQGDTAGPLTSQPSAIASKSALGA